MDMKMVHTKDVYLIGGPQNAQITEIGAEDRVFEMGESQAVTIFTPTGDRIIVGYLLHRYEYLCEAYDPKVLPVKRIINAFIYKGCRMKPMPRDNSEFINEIPNERIKGS